MAENGYNENKFRKKGERYGGKRQQVYVDPPGRKQPANYETEQAVLGALMLEKEALNEVIEILRPEAFHHEAHQHIFNAIKALFSKSEPIDLVTVTRQLRSTGELDIAKGAAYVTSLTQRVHSSANIEFHSRILMEYAIKRQLIKISNDVIRDAYEEETDVFELLDRSEQSLFEVTEMNIRKNYVSVNDVMTEAIRELEALRDNSDGLTGIPSGFTALDRVTSGWQRSDLVIFAARPGMGKTAFVLSSLRNASVEFDRPVAIFSLEMSATQLMKRLISSEAEISSEKIKTGKLSEHDWKKLVDKTSALADAKLFIDDTPALSVLELRAKCRRLKAQHDIQMVVIDYLQLMTGESSKNGNREQEIAMISRSLKQLAKELDVPVIALSQLSRAVETRGGDKKPQLSDLRESGSIEQDADMVIFLYRPEYYGMEEDEEGNSIKGMAEVIFAKNRHGSTTTVPLKFIGEYTKFVDWEGGSGLFPEFGNNMVSAAELEAEEHGGGGSTILKSSKMNVFDDFDNSSDSNVPPNGADGPDEVPF